MCVCVCVCVWGGVVGQSERERGIIWLRRYPKPGVSGAKLGHCPPNLPLFRFHVKFKSSPSQVAACRSLPQPLSPCFPAATANTLADQTEAQSGSPSIKLHVNMARESSKVKAISVHLFDITTPEKNRYTCRRCSRAVSTWLSDERKDWVA